MAGVEPETAQRLQWEGGQANDGDGESQFIHGLSFAPASVTVDWFPQLACTGEQPMSKYLTAVKKFVAKYITRKEEGATLAEYGLLLALIAVVCIVAITALGTKISSMFQSLASSI